MKREWRRELPKPRNYFIFYGFGGFVLLAITPTLIYPMLFPDKYREEQAENRRGIRQADIQPGNMNVWSDPFQNPKK